MSTTDRLVDSGVSLRLEQAAQQVAGLRLLILHGSRATGKHAPHSDWDFGYLGGELLDPAELHTTLTSVVQTDSVDLVDLATATALLRFRAARDGVALFECPAGAFLNFRVTATRFWCDAGPVIRAAQEDVLASLP